MLGGEKVLSGSGSKEVPNGFAQKQKLWHEQEAADDDDETTATYWWSHDLTSCELGVKHSEDIREIRGFLLRGFIWQITGTIKGKGKHRETWKYTKTLRLMGSLCLSLCVSVWLSGKASFSFRKGNDFQSWGKCNEHESWRGQSYFNRKGRDINSI